MKFGGHAFFACTLFDGFYTQQGETITGRTAQEETAAEFLILF